VSFAVDTNILLRSIDEGHPAQAIAENAISKLRNRGETAFVFPQNLVEFWAVATRPVANNGFGWSVERAADELGNLKRLFVVLDHSDATLPEWEKLVTRHRVIGKQAHDAHLVAAMIAHGVSDLITFNVADFKRYTEITAIDPRTIV